MTNENRRTFCDIEIILNALPEEDRNKVPLKLRKFISENKLEDYESNIRIGIPIEKQDVHPDTQTFLGMLYLNYWCKDEEEKKRLTQRFTNNESKYQKQINEKFEVFKENDNVQEMISGSDENQSEEFISKRTVESQESNMIVYKENIIKRILNRIFGIFRRKEYGK